MPARHWLLIAFAALALRELLAAVVMAAERANAQTFHADAVAVDAFIRLDLVAAVAALIAVYGALSTLVQWVRKKD